MKCELKIVKCVWQILHIYCNNCYNEGIWSVVLIILLLTDRRGDGGGVYHCTEGRHQTDPGRG